MVAVAVLALSAAAGARPPVAGPRAATGHIAAVTSDGAAVGGTVRRAGRPTTWWFQYGATTHYGAHTRPRPAAPGRHSVSAVLTRLAPATRYHARLVASTCGGCRASTAYGRDIAFTTPGYRNPVSSAGEAADPFVLDNNGAHDDYWAYVTGDGFPILRSSDLVHWRPAGSALAARPAWVRAGDWHPWAPNVAETDAPCPDSPSTGCYVMYYVGHSRAFGVDCVGIAFSTTPGGPFTDRGPLAGAAPDALGRPVGCGDNAGFGVIDPSLFIDPADGAPYLYVSVSYACPAGSTVCRPQGARLGPTVSVIPLTPDLLSAAGPRTPLFGGTPGTWEAVGVKAPTVEAPAGVFHDGTYYLLFSGGSWRGAYGMGYATAPAPTGPFTQAPAPILSATATVGGPGGGDVPVTGPHGGQWLVYHGRTVGDGPARTLRIDPFSWEPGPAGGPDLPVVGGPTSTPQSVVP